MRTVGPAHRERGVVEILADFTQTQGDEGVPSSVPLTAYPLCLRSALRRSKNYRRRKVGRHFLYSGRKGGATVHA